MRKSRTRKSLMVAIGAAIKAMAKSWVVRGRCGYCKDFEGVALPVTLDGVAQAHRLGCPLGDLIFEGMLASPDRRYVWTDEEIGARLRGAKGK